ncbi:putative porin [Pontiella sp.]|uniref:putative porin n=1 Tax=Pontiella sp. TaxID=2837462 RepID=UPI003563EF9E
MKKNFVYGIVLGIAASALPGFAAEEVDETTALREQVRLQQQQLEAIGKRLDEIETAPATEKSWADHIAIKGDIRARFENVGIDDTTTKSRLRARARIGVYADVNDRVFAGARLATGSDESPTSTNQSLEDFANKRAVWLDLMYMGYSFEKIDGLQAVVGKMKQPWEQVSDLMYDSDVNPEGLNFGYEKEFDAFTLIANLGYFSWQDKVSDNPATDAIMGAGQLAAKVDLGEHLTWTLGGGAFVYDNIAGTEIPVSESDNGTTTITDDNGDAQTVQIVKTKTLSNGNTEDGNGNWQYGYGLIEGFTKLDIKNGVVPFYLYGDYIVNAADGVDEDTAWLVGAGLKYKKLGLDYNYRDLEADAVIGLLADSDFSGGGTGGKGHKFQLKYALLKNWSAGLTYFITENRSAADVNTFLADLAVKF